MPDAPQLLVPAPVVQEIVNYLQRCPFKDVHQMIGALMACPAAKVAEPAPQAPKK